MRSILLGILGIAVAASVCCLAGSATAAELAGGSTAKVLILPFTAINQNDSQPWLGQSVQQSLAADLLAIAPGRIFSSQAPAPDDAAALDAARRLGTQYVIRGEFATVGGDVRITGQVLDIATSNPVTAIKATGPFTDLFAMEDQLTAQVRRRLSLAPSSHDAPPPVETAVPPMQGLQMPPQPPVDPYVQAYVAPLQTDPPAAMVYDYFYSTPSSNDGSTIGMGWIWPSWGNNGGYGFGNCGNSRHSGGNRGRGTGGTRGGSGGSGSASGGAHGSSSGRR